MLLFALLLNFAQAQTALPVSPWDALETYEIAATGKPTDKLVPLHIVVQTGSAWDRREVLLQQLTKTSKILGACNVGVGDVTVERVSWHAGLEERIKKASPYNPPAQLELAQGLEQNPERPTMFLFAKGIERTATAYNRKYTDDLKRMYPQANTESLLNMIIMTDHYVTNAFLPASDATYNTMAHEMVHIVGNTGHAAVRRNLMSSFETRGMQTGALTSEQCQLLQGFPY